MYLNSKAILARSTSVYLVQFWSCMWPPWSVILSSNQVDFVTFFPFLLPQNNELGGLTLGLFLNDFVM